MVSSARRLTAAPPPPALAGERTETSVSVWDESLPQMQFAAVAEGWSRAGSIIGGCFCSSVDSSPVTRTRSGIITFVQRRDSPEHFVTFHLGQQNRFPPRSFLNLLLLGPFLKLTFVLLQQVSPVLRCVCRDTNQRRRTGPARYRCRYRGLLFFFLLFIL